MTNTRRGDYLEHFYPNAEALVLIRYHFDYESAQIWWSAVLETSRHDPSVLLPCQGFDGTTWAESPIMGTIQVGAWLPPVLGCSHGSILQTVRYASPP